MMGGEGNGADADSRSLLDDFLFIGSVVRGAMIVGCHCRLN